MKVTFLTFIFYQLLSCLAVAAQQSPPLSPVKLSDFDNETPANCEYRSAVVDSISQKTPPDEKITVIAHLGTGDTRANLNRRRLENVRAYWTEFLGRRKPETIILFEGEKVEGYGRLDFYVGGNLVWVMKVARNADVDFGDCVPPDDSYIRHGVFNPCWIKSNQIFYPCRDKHVRRRKRQ